MARARIPDAMAMRALKYGRAASDAERDAVAQALREVGRRSEALLLYERRPDHPFLAEERAWAVDEGSAFHLVALARLGVEISPQAWRTCAERALAAARYLDARLAYQALDDEAALADLAEHLPDALQPEDAAEADEAS